MRKETSCSLATVRMVDCFAPTVQLVRLIKGLRQADVAERSGLPKWRVSELERGIRRPTRAVLEKYLEGLGIDLRFYLTVANILREVRRDGAR